MNKDQLKGKVEKVKGRVKDAAGALSGDKKTQVEGMVERVKGTVREGLGNAREAIEKGDRSPENDDE